MFTATLTGFDNIVGQATKFHGKVLRANDEIAEEARELILKRVATGKNTDGKKMAYKSSADSFWGNGKSKKVGDYSAKYANVRQDAGRGTSPMDLHTSSDSEANLYKSFTYRKRKAKSFSLEFFIRKNKNSNHRKNYVDIHEWLVRRFGNIFRPSKIEANKIGKLWKNRLK